MSDGCPTNTQFEKNIGFLKFLLSPFINLGASIVGGWIECIWESQNTYKIELLVTGGLVRYPDWINISKNVWINIMSKVNELKSSSEIYSIYFNTGGSDGPIYGLQQISSGNEYYYYAENRNKLINSFKEIANKIKKVDVAIGTQTSTGTITLEEVTKISAIKVGDNPISDAELQNIKNAIMSNAYYDAGEDKGPLDLNDFAYIFCTNEKITIVY